MQTLKLKSLQTSRQSKNMKGLASIQSPSYKSINKQYISLHQVTCAYHIGEKITNFCKSKNCLLPLCPKCIKIHTEQHQRMGFFGEFQTVQNCFRQIQKTHFQNMQILQRMIQFSQQMQSNNDYKIFCAKRQLQQAKQNAIIQLSTIFRQYQEALDDCLQKQGGQFCHQLTYFHQQVKALIQQQKHHMAKIYNKNLQMEFLIESYSKTNLNNLLQNYEVRLKQLSPKTIKIQAKQYELQRFHAVIKRYLDFSQFNQIISQKISQGKTKEMIKEYELNLEQKKTLSPFKYPDPRQRTNLIKIQSKSNYIQSSRHSPQKLKLSREYFGNDIYKHIEKESRLNSFQSPLDNFSLQRSRHERQLKRSQNQMILYKE